MKKKLYIKILSAVINILSCLIIALNILFRQNWFGSGDIYQIIFWTIPFVCGLTVSGNTIVNLFESNNLFSKLILIVLNAIILSFAWAYCVALLLGPWYNAFSIPILYLWITGSVLQLLFLEWKLPKPIERPKILKVIGSVLLFPLTSIIVFLVMNLIVLSDFYTIPPYNTTEKKYYVERFVI